MIENNEQVDSPLKLYTHDAMMTDREKAPEDGVFVFPTIMSGNAVPLAARVVSEAVDEVTGDQDLVPEHGPAIDEYIRDLFLDHDHIVGLLFDITVHKGGYGIQADMWLVEGGDPLVWDTRKMNASDLEGLQ